MWSLTSPRIERISSFRKFSYIPPKDFFDSIGQSRRSRRAERRRTLGGERHHPVVRRSLFNRGVMLTRKG
jgi:hypothetical protein